MGGGQMNVRIRVIIPVLMLAMAFVALSSTDPTMAAPFPGSGGVYQYSEMHTNATTPPNDDCGYCSKFNANSPYRGWVGVNGAIQILGPAGSMNTNDHALAALSASGSDGGSFGDFLQAGVFKGKIFESATPPPSCQPYTCVSSPTG